MHETISTHDGPQTESVIAVHNNQIREVRSQIDIQVMRLREVADRTFGMEPPLDNKQETPGPVAVETGLRETELCMEAVFIAINELTAVVNRLTVL